MEEKKIWNQENIKSKRLEAKHSQRDLARMLGIAQQRISEWECGVHKPKNAYQRLLTYYFTSIGISL